MVCVEGRTLSFWRSRYVEPALCGAVALLLHATPLLARGPVIPGAENSDALRGYWGAWLVAAELPSWPFTTELMAFPEGALALPLPPLTLVLVAPFTRALGAEWGIWALVVFHTFLAAWGALLLARELGATRGGAITAALVMASWPPLYEMLHRGVYEYLTVGWLALFLVTHHRALTGRWRWGLASGPLFIVVLLECGGFAPVLALAAVAVVPASLRGRWGLVGGLVSVASVAVAAGGWWLLFGHFYAIFLDGATANTGLRIAVGSMELSKSLWPVHFGHDYLSTPSALHLGAVGLALALLAWGRRWRALLFLVPVGVIWALVSLDAAPGFKETVGATFRYVRFVLGPFGIVLAVLAGLGVGEAMKRFRPRWDLQAGVLVGVLLFSAGELAAGWLWRYPMLWLPDRPSFMEELASAPDGGVLIVPQKAGRDEPGGTGHLTLREHARLSNDQARLWLQVETDKPFRHFVKLTTTQRASDILYGVDDPVVGRAVRIGEDDLAALRADGLEYVLIDEAVVAQFGGGEQVRRTLSRAGAACTTTEEWGGVSLCRFD